MRQTPAVGRAEAGKRHRASSQTGKGGGPGAFLPDGAVSVPDGHTFGFPAQIVDVPAQTSRGKIGCDSYTGVFSYGGMPYEESERSMRLFAEEVVPQLQRLGERAVA